MGKTTVNGRSEGGNPRAEFLLKSRVFGSLKRVLRRSCRTKNLNVFVCSPEHGPSRELNDQAELDAKQGRIRKGECPKACDAGRVRRPRLQRLGDGRY